jgi:2-polyprenyl-6-methoxyphenol hydroxylase-like FAD-dependent oxidoreductase
MSKAGVQAPAAVVGAGPAGATAANPQAAGLAREIMADAIQNVPLKFFDSAGRCSATVQASVPGFGWYERNIFMQPIAEAVLRRGLDRFPHVQARFGAEVTDLEQDEHGVTLHTEHPAAGMGRHRRRQ